MDRLGGSKVADLHVSRLRMLYIATSARCHGATSLVHRVRERVGFVPSTCSMSPDFGDGDKRCSNVHSAHEVKIIVVKVDLRNATGHGI